MKNIMFGINIIVLLISSIMAVIFVVGKASVDPFTGFLVTLAIVAYSYFNAMAIHHLINK